MNPWDRLPAESTPAYEAARSYFEMGQDRSVDAVGQKWAKGGSLISRWCGQHSWVERAALYDAHMHRIEQAAAEKARASEAAKWARRQVEQRERDWALAETLREKAAKMLGFPLATVRKSEDGAVTIIEPARWTMRDAAAIAELAAKLARLAAEMATEHKHVDVTKLPDDELERMARGEG